jgi:hypothetical protein
LPIRIGISKAGRFLEDFIPFFLSGTSIYLKDYFFKEFFFVAQMAIINRNMPKKW